MRSKIVVKIEQHFEDGSIIDWSDILDDTNLCVVTNGFGARFVKTGKEIKHMLAKELQKQLFKEQCRIEV